MAAQICLPVEESLLTEIDSLVTLMGSPWNKPTRVDIARVGLALGISALKAQACATVSVLAAKMALSAGEIAAHFEPPASTQSPVVGSPGEVPEETTSSSTTPKPSHTEDSDLDPVELRKRLNKAIADGVRVADLAQDLNVGVSYIYAFRGGKSMNHERRVALSKALSARESIAPAPEAKASKNPAQLKNERIRERLKKAVAGGAKIVDLAKRAGVPPFNFYAFNTGHNLGPEKLDALDKQLTNLEQPPPTKPAPLRNRPNVVLTRRNGAETSGEITTRIVGALSEADTVLTLPQIQDRVREPVAKLTPAIAQLIAEKRLDVTGVGGIAAYRLDRAGN